MSGKQHRRSVSDRARRRAIRALAARLGVAYSVAARLLTARQVGVAPVRFPTGTDKHRAWLFAMREQRTLDLRVRDTRLAADLPLGRAAHLTERFPRLRQTGATDLYAGEGRQAALALLYAVLAHEKPALPPSAESLGWVGELGEEAAVDSLCAALDRAARLLLDEDVWRLCTRIEAAIGSDSDRARALAPEFRAMVPRKAFGGARQILDALLAVPYGAHPPGSQVRIVTGERAGETALVVGAHWQHQGPPTHYRLQTEGASLILEASCIAVLDDEPLVTAPA
ncbi:hypothetical protein [Allorhizocola rhizosphaerae]|uniref:hypothetical protein n=1 Tax=Allorhizocola rhizosphaerae TaxID=1872709 RepID=UPI000E3C1C3B|nr:hypothetical protein [Allorhizocola rhizosphaerae]